MSTSPPLSFLHSLPDAADIGVSKIKGNVSDYEKRLGANISPTWDTKGAAAQGWTIIFEIVVLPDMCNVYTLSLVRTPVISTAPFPEYSPLTRRLPKMRTVLKPFMIHASYSPIEMIVFSIVGTLAYFHVLSAIKHSAFFATSNPTHAPHTEQAWVNVREHAWHRARSAADSSLISVELEQVVYSLDSVQKGKDAACSSISLELSPLHVALVPISTDVEAVVAYRGHSSTRHRSRFTEHYRHAVSKAIQPPYILTIPWVTRRTTAQQQKIIQVTRCVPSQFIFPMSLWTTSDRFESDKVTQQAVDALVKLSHDSLDTIALR
ncbi:hypothetical protein BDZ89DRAFT_1133109 [Hymenopellis radicata]|nr:hypothetical protein BDZ89DRAFT_1133109 [Hymenopellis radicata]